MTTISAPSGTSTVAAGVNTDATSGTTLKATLNINFRDVFGSADVATITASVDHVTFHLRCINNGGKTPSADSKDVTVPGSATSDEFPVDKNGNVTGSLTLSSSLAGSLLPCSPGQNTEASATFFSIHLEDNASPPHTFDIPSVTTATIIF